MINVDYKIITAELGSAGCDAVNKFTDNNPKWALYNTIPLPNGLIGFIFTKTKDDKPGSSTPGGALKDAALLTESTNVTPFRRAA